ETHLFSNSGPPPAHIWVTDRPGNVVTDIAAFDPNTSNDPGPTPLTERLGSRSLSFDGRYVTFWSGAPQLVIDGDTANPIDLNPNGSAQLYLYDRNTGQVTLVSHALGNPTAGGNDDSGTLNFAGGSDDNAWASAMSA